MEDWEIVRLYWQRSERAIEETAHKYGAYCHAIASRIVGDDTAAEECVNDTYLGAWSSMPPHEPAILATFLGKLTRRIAINCWKKDHAQKRGGSQVPLALEELAECVDGSQDPAAAAAAGELAEAVDRFVMSLAPTERRVFICRYWYLETNAEICRRYGFSSSKVKTMLCRTRQKLADHLKKEGFL